MRATYRKRKGKAQDAASLGRAGEDATENCLEVIRVEVATKVAQILPKVTNEKLQCGSEPQIQLTHVLGILGGGCRKPETPEMICQHHLRRSTNSPHSWMQAVPGEGWEGMQGPLADHRHRALNSFRANEKPLLCGISDS